MSVELLPAIHGRFTALLRELAARNRGSTMRDLAAAYTLAEALEADDVDAGLVAELATCLGLGAADLEDHGVAL